MKKEDWKIGDRVYFVGWDKLGRDKIEGGIIFCWRDKYQVLVDTEAGRYSIDRDKLFTKDQEIVARLQGL